MSQQGQYTLKLVVDDSAIKKLEEKMNKLMNGGSITGATGGGQGGAGVNPLQHLGKLGLIATGVGTLVIMVKKIVEKLVASSPALQAMLQILETSVTLILRPFGDFIAFLLKPILLIFLQKVALPFYKILDAPFIKAGQKAGENIVNNPGATITGTAIGGWLGGLIAPQIANWLEESGRVLNGWWLLFLDNFKNIKVPEWMIETWQGILNFFETLKLPDWLMDIWYGIVDFFSTLQVPDWLIEIWNGVVNFFGSLTVPEWMLGMWDGIVGFFDTLKIPEWLMNIWNGITNFFATLTIPEWLLNIWYGVTSFFATLKIPQWVYDIIDGFFAFLKRIGDWLASIPTFFKELLGLGGNNNKTENKPQAKLEININEGLNNLGQAGNNLKNEVMGWFNEWLK